MIGWGILVAPFDWDTGLFPRSPVPVDAIPDIEENQQVVFTEWPGRSPQDIEDQVTYPLTTALLGMPGVRTVRSFSYFGFSTVYVIFEDDIEFYWSRSRVLEKLASLPKGTLPDGAEPALGPDATALGQVFWYTLEGQDSTGAPTGSWDLHELRSIQDWTVRYALQSAHGVAEVASIGGYVKEYQVDVDPGALKAFGVTLSDVVNAVRNANVDIGARSMEINRVEYIVRGLGLINSIEDIENTVVLLREEVPVRLTDVANVSMGPASRRGALDKGGAETVGGVVVVRHGENPLEVIKNVKDKIVEIAPGLPKRTLADGTVSQVRIVPFYDRTGLIYETLNTLNTALIDEILVTIIVVILMVMHIRSSLLISGLLPLTVLMVFIAMKLFGVDANIVALSGIAIAIGTIVDMGIVVTENILRHLQKSAVNDSRLEIIYEAVSEVGGAVLTAIATTVISFLPVFAMEAAEGKLFKPLAYTKTFALIASVMLALIVIPPAAYALLGYRRRTKSLRLPGSFGLLIAGITLLIWSFWWSGILIIALAVYVYVRTELPHRIDQKLRHYVNYIIVLFVAGVLASHWKPMGIESGFFLSLLFVAAVLGGFILLMRLIIRFYEPILRWCLNHKTEFIVIPLLIIVFGILSWIGFDSVSGPMPSSIKSSSPFVWLDRTFPGLGNEFMPDLDEGSFLYMPTTMPHASIGEVLDVLQHQDKAFASIPEVESVVGKLGRADSPLDPAPISMIETVINYKPEYVTDASGKILRFEYDASVDSFTRDESGRLIQDSRGRPYRQWRDHVRSPDDIWNEILRHGKITGTTSAPKLQPISTRIVMLQSGMRAPMGIKIKGPDLETIESFSLEVERFLKEVPSIDEATVIADRIVGKPYIEIDIDRDAAARYGLAIRHIQDVIEVAIGGKSLTTTIEGRERYSVRVRYPRELRTSFDDIGEVLVPTAGFAQIPLEELAEIKFVRGPMVIKSEDTFLTGYVIFDKTPGSTEVDVVAAADQYLRDMIAAGSLEIPTGVSYRFAGSWENQVRSEKKLRVVLPAALLLIFVVLYLQFRKVSTSLIVFTGVFVAWAGGFIMLWLYGQDWFLNISLMGTDLRQLFGVRQYNLSVAVWVGFLALFGIATDDGVIIATYLKQAMSAEKPNSIQSIREAVIIAGKRRIRPAMMTVATTILALLPVLTSTGKGSEIMVPMAIPSFGGMLIAVVTVFVVPTLYSALAERKLRRQTRSDNV